MFFTTAENAHFKVLSAVVKLRIRRRTNSTTKGDDAMATSMLASDVEMTDGQIDDLVNKLRDAARKHRDEVSKDHAQEALRSENIGMRLFATFRALVNELSKQIVHVVSVNRARSPREALKASGRKLYVTDSVVDAMPRGTGDKVRLVYFKPDPSAYKNGWLSCDALAKEYKKRGLVPDPQAQIDDNATNPEFADTTPNGCQWVEADGNFCYATFDRWFDERNVFVYRYDDGWDDFWSFSGVPQESLPSGT